jgi:15-cis-phytoene synthase
MRMDLTKARYATYEELYEYCYRVAGAVGLMTTPVMGVAPAAAADPEPTLRAALALGTANQLTNILRDVGEDAQQRNRVYVPLEDLEAFGIAEAEVVSGSLVRATTKGGSASGGPGQVDERWKRFMAFQIDRARACFADAEAGIGSLDADARWPVWSALILYRQILDAIEKNGYDNFTRRAYVDKWRKYASLPAALMRARQGL